jgi:hypothetical protein
MLERVLQHQLPGLIQWWPVNFHAPLRSHQPAGTESLLLLVHADSENDWNAGGMVGVGISWGLAFGQKVNPV